MARLHHFVASAPGLAALVDANGVVCAASLESGLSNGDVFGADLRAALTPSGAQDTNGRLWSAARMETNGENRHLFLCLGRTLGPNASQRFTAAVSHEIRTPLNGILGMVALLEETELAPAQKEYAAAIRKSGTRLLDLLNNVLDYSRFEAGELLLDEAPFDPRDLIQDVVELIAPRAHLQGLDIAAIAAPGLSDKYQGDVGRLRQILFNLAGNAAKFTETGGVLIKAEPKLADRGLRLSVYDTGPGVPAANRDRLFHAFSQVSAADAGRDGGVGLGLAIVARLVGAMGGRVSIDSPPEGGSAFHVDLPLKPFAAPPERHADIDAFAGRNIYLDLPPASKLSFIAAFGRAGARLCPRSDIDRADLAVLDAATSPLELQDIARRTPTLVVLRPEDRASIPKFREFGAVGYLIRPLRARSIVDRGLLAMAGVPLREADGLVTESAQNLRVLIADDNPVNALLAKRALEADGYNVDVAGSGAEALEAAAQTRYDVVFMDVRMPVMDGLEATQRIRALPGASAKTPIIAVTADVDPDLEAKARAVGVSLVASKPIDPAGLRALAKDWALGAIAS